VIHRGQLVSSCVPFLQRIPDDGSPVPDQLTFDLDAESDNDSPLLGTAKNERTLMAYNFFSLTREHQTELPRYDDGKFSIEVVGTKYGSTWSRFCTTVSTTAISRPRSFSSPPTTYSGSPGPRQPALPTTA
jgi:hypothetical protein